MVSALVVQTVPCAFPPETQDGFAQVLREDAIPIMDQLAIALFKADHLTQLLQHPDCRRVIGHIEVQ
jgi:hypothetical protein